MIESKTARELNVGDTLSTSGAVITQVVPSHHGQSVYIRAEFDDGYTQVVTIDAETVVHVYHAQ
jgi:hypothetical protein